MREVLLRFSFIFPFYSAKPFELPTSGSWIDPEIDALASFLSSSGADNYKKKDENGLDVFDRFAATEVGLFPPIVLSCSRSHVES